MEKICRSCLQPFENDTQKTLCDTCRAIVAKEAGRRGSEKSRKRLGDRYKDKFGYVHVRVNGTLVAEHRKVLEDTIGRKLRPGESAHHKNGIRDDNRPENIELWVGPIRYGQRASDIVCHACGAPYRL